MRHWPLALAIAVLSACSGEGIPEPQAPDIEGEWPLRQPAPYIVEPGERFEMEVQNLHVDDLGEVVLWFGDDNVIRPMARRIIDDGGDDESYADDTISFIFYTPFLKEGTEYVALGTTEKRYTGDALLYVQIPERRYAQVQVAEFVTGALHSQVTKTRFSLLEHYDERVRGFYEDRFGSQGLETIAGLLDDVDALAETFGETYMEIDSSEERGVQAFLYNTGVIDWALIENPMTTPGTTSQAVQVITSGDKSAHPIHVSLYALDFLSMRMSITSQVLSLGEIVGALSGVGAPVAAGLTVANVVVITLKALIDNFMPTDLASIHQGQDQRILYADKSQGWVYWGVFEAQNGSGDPFSLEGLLAEIIASAIPGVGGKAGAIIKKVTPIIGTVLARAGIELTDYFTDLEDIKAIPVLVQMNMAVYSALALDMLSNVPVVGLPAEIFKQFGDLELASPLTLEWDSNEPLARPLDWDVSFDYSIDQLFAEDIEFPAGQDVVFARASVSAFSWKPRTTAFGFVTYPGWDDFSFKHGQFEIRKAADPDDANETDDDEDFIITRVYSADDQTTPIAAERIEIDTPTARPYTFNVSDPVLNSGVETISVSVNGVEQIASLAVVGNAPMPLVLQPGRNAITIKGLIGHDDPSIFSGKYLRMAVRIPQGRADQLREVHVDPQESFTFYIWTPPAVPTD